MKPSVRVITMVVSCYKHPKLVELTLIKNIVKTLITILGRLNHIFAVRQSESMFQRLQLGVV